MDKGRIAFFVPALHGGGAERVAVNLLQSMSKRDIPLDLVLASAEGPYLEQVPKQVRLFDLGAGRVLNAILPLARYLRQEKPCALLSHMNYANVAAVIARDLSGTKPRLVLVDHSNTSDPISEPVGELLRTRLVYLLMKRLYLRADAVVGVSRGVARDVESHLGIAEGKVNVVYNPVVDDVLVNKAKAPLDHPWFEQGAPPVFLAVGRLTQQKDFLTLVKAFELVRRQRAVRLIVLGEGESRSELEEAIARLGISEDVSMPGFMPNPYAYMSKASAFVLSSRWEGLPTVLIEAMACGCPVIATDCPNGPKEILDAGTYGSLVPIEDAAALSVAMLQVLDAPVSQDMLIERAMYFSSDRAVDKYLALLGYFPT
jgi:glycosyltransferase involved in cell wall biosynthesis